MGPVIDSGDFLWQQIIHTLYQADTSWMWLILSDFLTKFSFDVHMSCKTLLVIFFKENWILKSPKDALGFVFFWFYELN